MPPVSAAKPELVPDTVGGDGGTPIKCQEARSVSLLLSIHCQDLVNKDFLSKSDPACVVYMKNKKGNWKEVGRTERVKNNLNPKFKRKIEVDFVPSIRQEILFELYDIDKDNTTELQHHDFLGRYQTEIQQLVDGNVSKRPLESDEASSGSKSLGCITVTAEDAEHKFVLPPSHEWIKHGRVLKKEIGALVSWHELDVVLCREHLAFLQGAEETLADWIPLHEIALVKEVEDEGGDEDAKFVIQTLPEGRNSGRSYVLSASTDEEVRSWCSQLQLAVHEEQARRRREQELSEFGGNSFVWFRFKTQQMYESTLVQAFIAMSIIASFFIDCVQAELQPEESDQSYHVLSTMNFAIMLFFAFELAVNLFSRSSDLFHPFYSNKWNLFEVVIVSLSVFSYVIYSKTLRYVSLFRTLRMFRVIRIFKGLRDLNRIMGALGAALLPLLNAFMIQLLITCVYAVLATHLFSDLQPQFFGTFSASLFTMFQIVTGDSWASAVTRTLFVDGRIDRSIAFFFVSYVLVAGVVLVNIVIAVLLDEFTSTVTREKEEIKRKIQEEQERQAKAARINGVLDPLLSSIASFNDMNDFNAKMADVYLRLDTDKGGGLDFSEFKNGL